jgi:hypothetical protein
MYHQATDVLQELQSRQCPHFIVHIFSNGGCFLWEWISHLLLQPHRDDLGINVQSLRGRLVGRVFDSSPANYEGRPDGIIHALQHITPTTEKNRLLQMAKKVDAYQVNLRHEEFWNKMCTNHDVTVPELYLYSENDSLTSLAPLQKLICKRREILGKDNVWTHNFLDSEHCCHLLKYPNMYDSILGKFIGSCSGGDCGVDGKLVDQRQMISKL